MRRTERERRRLAIAHALRNARRLLQLAENPLLEDQAVLRLAHDRYDGSVMAETRALSDLVLEAANTVLDQIRRDQRFKREAIVLASVLSGWSVQAAARQLGRRREHISNTAWRTVTCRALDEFERLRTVRYNARGDGNEQRTVVKSPAVAPSP